MAGASPDFGKSKSEGVRSNDRMKAYGGGLSSRGGGGDSAEDRSNGGYGPTGSSRSYPKSSAAPSNSQDMNKRWNPAVIPATDNYVGGVD